MSFSEPFEITIGDLYARQVAAERAGDDRCAEIGSRKGFLVGWIVGDRSKREYSFLTVGLRPFDDCPFEAVLWLVRTSIDILKRADEVLNG